jgi:hypothetical protein
VIFDRILDDAALFPPLRAKFRTGGVTADAYPDEPELAEAIHLTVAHGLTSVGGSCRSARAASSSRWRTWRVWD